MQSVFSALSIVPILVILAISTVPNLAMGQANEKEFLGHFDDYIPEHIPRFQTSFFHGASWVNFCVPDQDTDVILGGMPSDFTTNVRRIFFGDYSYLVGPGNIEGQLFSGNAISRNATVEDGAYTFVFDIGGDVTDGSFGHYELSDQLFVRTALDASEPASLTLLSPSPPPEPVVVARRMRAGNLGADEQGAPGQITIDGAYVETVFGAAFWNSNGQIINGGKLVSGFDFAVSNLCASLQNVVEVEISGQGSLWHNVNTQFWINHQSFVGLCILTVSGGGELRAGNAVLIGSGGPGMKGVNGILNVQGAGSSANVGFLRIFGDSATNITNGGRLTTDSNIDIGGTEGAEPSLFVSGSQSVVDVGGSLSMSGSPGGPSLLTVSGSAEVNVNNSAFVRIGSRVDLNGGSITIGDAEHLGNHINIGPGGTLIGSSQLDERLQNSGGIIQPTNFEDGLIGAFAGIDQLILESGDLQIDVDSENNVSDLIEIAADGSVVLGGILQVSKLGKADLAGKHFTIIEGFDSISGQFQEVNNFTGQEFEIVVVDDRVEIQFEILLGDVNGDGLVTLLDVAPFIAVLLSGNFEAVADINGDGTIDLLDIQPFVNLLIG